MKRGAAKIYSLGENALTVSFGDEISLATNERVLNLASRFERENHFKGFVEIVPTYTSLTIFYDVPTVRKNFPEFATAFDAVKNFAETALRQTVETVENKQRRLIEISVDFSSEFAPDLEFIATEKNLSAEVVIEIFTARTYRVFMLGFLPGFAYMGEVDERISVPRKQNPRELVPQGSVGIAGRQTGIYSLASPGGWQIIGRTDARLFTPELDVPTFLQAGDEVKFSRATKFRRM
ncbi:MAG: 5-oxoprolinase subunit PxpB [Acidobacteria bacterium]|nr:5-oxoprolinase subunit PxpB [Acidobacteriota bacterium]